MGPQGELDAGDDEEEEDGEADHELREPLLPSSTRHVRPCPVCADAAGAKLGSRSLDVVGRGGELGHDDADDDDGGGHDEGGDDDPRGDLAAFVAETRLVRADT